MARRTSPFFLVLYVAGLALLLLAFNLLIPASWRTDTAWLDLVVVAVVFTLNFPLASMLWSRTGNIETKFPALSVFWWFDGLYTFTALAGIAALGAYGWAFRFQLIYQLVALFGLVFALGLAFMASGQAERIQGDETVLKAGLTGLRSALAEVDDAASLLGAEFSSHRSALQKLKEDVRFLSPSGREREKSLEEGLTRELVAIRTLLQPDPPASVHSDLDRHLAQCAALMNLRKQANIRQGDPS